MSLITFLQKRWCSVKKVFLEILQISQENTSVRASLLKLQTEAIILSAFTIQKCLGDFIVKIAFKMAINNAKMFWNQ